MKDYIGGYIFIPIAQGLTPAAIIRTVVQKIGQLQDVCAASIWHEEDEDWIDVPLAELYRFGRGCIHLYTNGLDITIQFEPGHSDYHLVCISIYNIFLTSHKYKNYVETFVPRWSNLCEDVQAEFGYFSRSDHTTTPWYRDREVLPALERKHIAHLLQQLSSYWLVYIGPLLVPFIPPGRLETIQKKYPYLLAAMKAQVLPSEALFIRTSTEAVLQQPLA